MFKSVQSLSGMLPEAGWGGSHRRRCPPQVPNPGHAVLPARVHPPPVLVEAHGGDVLADAVVVNDGVGVVGVEVVHADVLVACNNDRAGGDRRSPDPCPGRRGRGDRVGSPAAAIMLRSGVISRAFTCCRLPLRSVRRSRDPSGETERSQTRGATPSDRCPGVGGGGPGPEGYGVLVLDGAGADAAVRLPEPHRVVVAGRG